MVVKYCVVVVFYVGGKSEELIYKFMIQSIDVLCVDEILELSGVCNDTMQKTFFGGCKSKAWENIKQHTFS